MRKFVWLFLLMLSTWSPALSLQVLEPTLVQGERLHVVMSVEDKHIDWTKVDLTPWLLDFNVQKTQIVPRWHQQQPAGSDYHLWLEPLVEIPDGETTQLVLPALSYEGEVSNEASVSISSLAGTDIWMRPSRMASQARVNELHRYSAEVYVVGTPDFRARSAVVNGRSFRPTDERKGDVTIAGKTFQNYSLNFELEPTNTGTLTIQWPSLSGNLIDQSGWLRSVTLNVAPRQYQVVQSTAPSGALVVDSAWLDVQVNNMPERLTVGDSLSFTVTQYALGAAKEYLTALDLEGKYEGYTIYEVNNARSETRHGNGWLASLTTEYSLLVDEAGRLSLPTMSLSFFHPRNQRFESVYANRLDNLVAKAPLPTFNVKAPVAIVGPPVWLWPMVYGLGVGLLLLGGVLWWQIWRKPQNRFARRLNKPNPETVWRVICEQAKHDGVLVTKLVDSPDWPKAIDHIQQQMIQQGYLSTNYRRTLIKLGRQYRPPAPTSSPFI
ncbi:BatD family protein [Salinibius halmophilus]|uniref:BatD family protein n=1 Tax=Salinibius halmophilus TaxID=1853216 RepID=UPI000E66F53C|nr:BatD family protein [Salinibius halmophilus]